MFHSLQKALNIWGYKQKWSSCLLQKQQNYFLDYTNSSFTVYIKIGNQLKNVCWTKSSYND